MNPPSSKPSSPPPDSSQSASGDTTLDAPAKGNADAGVASDDARHAELLGVLKATYGHDGFRPMQEQIISESLAGRDALVVMPTGGGKSLCYQLPALFRDGVTLVVSPLIALMEDQVKALEGNGVSATVLNSSVDYQDILQRERDAIAGKYKLLYMAPERLASQAGDMLLRRLNLAMIAIDEAHCISEWGHDFRPEYRQLGRIRQQYPDVPVMALTATATPRVADDVVAQLGMVDASRFRSGFERDNLYYEVRPKQKVTEQILAYMQANPSHEGIIYCQSRAKTEDLAARLQDQGIAALPYHAGLDHDVRREHQHSFVYGDTQVMTATIAFGMGIDKPDVRFVFHADLPRHIEGYYQETGRAGRDGLPADCILFFSPGDRARIQHFIDERPPGPERDHAMWQLDQMVAFAYATGCRCTPLLSYFGESHDGGCNHCDNCRQPPVTVDATQNARKLLSAVARTDQRFGLGHLIDVLRGSQSERVIRLGHDQLSVYGIGEDESAAYWRRLGKTLIDESLLGQTRDQYPTCHLTEASLSLLRGNTTFEIIQPRSLKQKSVRKSTPASLDGLEVDQAMFDRLRNLRRDIATEQQVPPYVVFADRSLQEMAARKPADLEAMAEISGVGAFKLEKYGQAFLDAINEPAGDG